MKYNGEFMSIEEENNIYNSGFITINSTNTDEELSLIANKSILTNRHIYFEMYNIKLIGNYHFPSADLLFATIIVLKARLEADFLDDTEQR